MSAQGPSHPLGDRPRMAEALASLKEGLRDTADPLYDGWKRRPPRGPDLANPIAAPTEGAPRAPIDKGEAAKPGVAGPNVEASQTIEISLDGTPDSSPCSDSALETPRLERGAGEDDPAVPSAAEPLADALPTEEQLIEVDHEDFAPPAERRPSVQTDTVKVRIIRYQTFPRWALIAAAAFFVFAVSVLVLRSSFPRRNARAARAVLTNEATSLPAINVDHAVSGVPGAIAPKSSPSVAFPVESSAGTLTPRTGEVAFPEDVAPASQVPASSSSRSATVSAAPPAAKTPPSSSRRRTGGHDFFRDPGF